MILEAACIPSHLIRQESDWKKLCAKFSGLDQYFHQKNTLSKILKPAYLDYVSHFSAPLISLSLNRAMFLFFFSKLIQSKQILDLGSGFSSYVFGLHIQQHGTGGVISVDDSDFWLGETRRFLEKHKVTVSQLWSLDQYHRCEQKAPDLGFLDLGDISMRQQLLPDLLNKVKRSQMILILDDFHIPAYRRFIIHLCKEMEVSLCSLRKVTRRRLSHMALVMH
jgi:hypothetical protein